MRFLWIGMVVLGLAALRLSAQEVEDARDPCQEAWETPTQEAKATLEAWATLLSEKEKLEPAQFMEGLRQVMGEHPLLIPFVAQMAHGLFQQGNYGPSGLLFGEALGALPDSAESIFFLEDGVYIADTVYLTLWNNLLVLSQKTYGDLRSAKMSHESILETRRKVFGEEHPGTLSSMNNLANILFAQGKVDRAQKLQEQIYEIIQRALGEEHLYSLYARSNLAITLKATGALDRAEKLQRQALLLLRRDLGEEHPSTLTAMNNLAITRRARGDLSGARVLHQQAFEGFQKLLGDDHPSTQSSRRNLGITLNAQGDLAGARELQGQGQGLENHPLFQEDYDPELSPIKSLMEILDTTERPQTAADLCQPVFEIFEQVLEDDHAEALSSISDLAINREDQRGLGDVKTALSLAVGAMYTLHGEEHPDHLQVMNELAGTLVALGDLDRARELHEQAVEVRRRTLGENHPDTLLSMSNLASTLFEEGDHGEALALWLQVLGILVDRSDGSDHAATRLETTVLHNLGLAYRQLKNLEKSREFFLRALDSHEKEVARADVTEEIKIKFREQSTFRYLDAVMASLALADSAEALHSLERYRAQSLLTMLIQEREASGQVPVDLEAKRRQVAARYDAVFRQLERLDPREPQNASRIRSLQGEQSRLRRQREVNEAAIRKALVGDAAEALEPMTAQQTQQQLSTGTLQISFIVGPERSFTFLLSQEDGLEVHEIEVGLLDLRNQLSKFRHLLASTETLHDFEKAATHEERLGIAKWLFKRLLGKSQDRIAKSERLLILPDGPLHYLPFAALVRETQESDRGWQYLAEWRPIHIAASATVYNELRSRRKEEKPSFEYELVAFGDPLYPGPPKGGAEDKERAYVEHLPSALRSAMQRGVFDGLERLIHSGREVREIGRLFPQEAAKIYEREQAREENAKAEIQSSRYVHFAAHGFSYSEPGDSWIALTLNEKGSLENGLLQAWEVMGGLELNADLVALSACESAFGPQSGGEGILSLSRAFQIAGAQTVAASLWNVSDASTAELMIRFYKHLQSGKTKNEALRAVQMDFIAGPVKSVDEDGQEALVDFSDPYYWASFQLYGDWE